MKVLTVKQPWAQLICEGIKDIENRTWRTNIRGRVLIHASNNSWSWYKVMNYITEAMTEVFVKMGYTGTWLRNLQKGAIIGSVEIVDCVQNHPSIWAEKTKYECRKCLVDKYDWQTCQECKRENKQIYNWVLANPILFDKPIENVKGKLSFWDYNDYKLTK